MSSWARRVESPLKFVSYVKENENIDRCGRGRVCSSDNQIKKPSIYQKKSLHKKEFKIGQATPKKQGPVPGKGTNYILAVGNIQIVFCKLKMASLRTHVVSKRSHKGSLKLLGKGGKVASARWQNMG